MSPTSGDESNDREIKSNTDDELSLDKETLKDLDAPPGQVAGQAGTGSWVDCVSQSCISCISCVCTIGGRV